MKKVWLKNYEAGVPYCIDPIKYRNLGEYIAKQCCQYRDHIAFSNLGVDMTYETVDKLSDYLSKFLRGSLNLKKNDRVAIMLPNLLQYPVILFACFKAGFTVVNVNPLYTADELNFQLKDSGADTLFVLSNFANTVEKACQTFAIKNIIITDVGDLLGFTKGNAVNFILKYIKRVVPKHRLKDVTTFKQALKLGKALPQNLKMPKVNQTDVALLQYTGGTTGVSKAAILSHDNLLSNISQSYLWIKDIASESNEVLITALPLYHIFSLTVNCMIFFGLGAQNVLISNPRDIQHFIQTLKKYHFTVITGVNTLFHALLSHPKFKAIDFSYLKLTLSGGMSVQESVAKRWEAVTQKPLLEAYGLTETSPGAIINPIHTQSYNGTVGLPLPSTDIKLCDDAGREVAFNTPGELLIKGPQVMLGYWNRPDETNACLQNGWLKTGDIAVVNEEGYVKIVDRKKDMILISGFNVYPNQVEQVLSHCPGVKEVGVIGECLEENIEIVVAYIVKEEQSLTAEAIIDYAREYLTAYKVPKKILFIESLPKTNVGKISRKDLKAIHGQQK